jgi:hypothetical protein
MARKLNALAAAEAMRQEEMRDAAEEAREDLRLSKLTFLDRDGNMLMYRLTIHEREGAPDPLPVVVNDYQCVIKRGLEVVVPWFVVTSLNDRVETKYQPGRDPDSNRLVMRAHSAIADAFNAKPINPGESVPY